MGAPAGSGSNYFITGSGCENILGLTVTLEVTQDIISTNGFSIQLNADSSLLGGTAAWQQYVFQIQGNSIKACIETWDPSIPPNTITCGCETLNITTPISNGIPSGYKLVLQLQYNGDGSVTGARYQVLNHSNLLWDGFYSVQQADADCNCGIPCLGFQAGVLAPITAFQLVIVGPGIDNIAYTEFASGAGNITYSVSSGEISAQGNQPMCTRTTATTKESSNASYGALGSCPAQSITQTFSAK